MIITNISGKMKVMFQSPPTRKPWILLVVSTHGSRKNHAKSTNGLAWWTWVSVVNPIKQSIDQKKTTQSPARAALCPVSLQLGLLFWGSTAFHHKGFSIVLVLPSRTLSHNYGESPFLTGKSHEPSMAMCHVAMLNYQRLHRSSEVHLLSLLVTILGINEGCLWAGLSTRWILQNLGNLVPPNFQISRLCSRSNSENRPLWVTPN